MVEWSSTVQVDDKPPIWKPLRWRTYGDFRTKDFQDVYFHFSDEKNHADGDNLLLGP